MSQRLRKLVGSIVLVVFVIAYALVVMVVAAAWLQGASGLVQLVFFLVTGLAWVIPAGLLIRWMQRPRSGETSR